MRSVGTCRLSASLRFGALALVAMCLLVWGLVVNDTEGRPPTTIRGIAFNWNHNTAQSSGEEEVNYGFRRKTAQFFSELLLKMRHIQPFTHHGHVAPVRPTVDLASSSSSSSSNDQSPRSSEAAYEEQDDLAEDDSYEDSSTAVAAASDAEDAAENVLSQLEQQAEMHELQRDSHGEDDEALMGAAQPADDRTAPLRESESDSAIGDTPYDSDTEDGVDSVATVGFAESDDERDLFSELTVEERAYANHHELLQRRDRATSHNMAKVEEILQFMAHVAEPVFKITATYFDSPFLQPPTAEEAAENEAIAKAEAKLGPKRRRKARRRRARAAAQYRAEMGAWQRLERIQFRQYHGLLRSHLDRHRSMLRHVHGDYYREEFVNNSRALSRLHSYAPRYANYSLAPTVDSFLFPPMSEASLEKDLTSEELVALEEAHNQLLMYPSDDQHLATDPRAHAPELWRRRKHKLSSRRCKHQSTSDAPIGPLRVVFGAEIFFETDIPLYPVNFPTGVTQDSNWYACAAPSYASAGNREYCHAQYKPDKNPIDSTRFYVPAWVSVHHDVWLTYHGAVHDCSRVFVRNPMEYKQGLEHVLFDPGWRVSHVKRVAVITFQSSLFYWDFMQKSMSMLLTVLPLLHQDRSIKLLTPKLPFILTLLPYFNISVQDQWQPMHLYRKYIADTVFVPSWDTNHGYSPIMWSYVRDVVRSQLPPDYRPPELPKRLILIIQRGETRRLDPIDKLQDALNTHFPTHRAVVFAPETVSYPTMMDTFAHAEVIVSAHGSGLTNLVFAKPGTCVLELMPVHGGIVPWCFHRMSCSLQFQYLRLCTPHGKHDIIWHVDVQQIVDHLQRSCAHLGGEPFWPVV